MRVRFVVLLALAVVPLAACSTGSEDMVLLHREITDVQRQVQQLSDNSLDKQDLQVMESRMAELSSQSMRSNADLAAEVNQLQEQIEALHASLELTTRQLQNISQDLAASRGRLSTGAVLPPVTAAEGEEAADAGGDEAAGSGGETVPAAGAASSPEELYRSAYEDYMRGNYDLAAQGFRDYMERWPDTELTDNALYWIGECYDAQNEPQQALDVFTQVLDEYPTSDKAAAAQLKKGLLYLKMNDQAQGVVHLQYVVYEYPGTREADLARERLRSLGLTIR